MDSDPARPLLPLPLLQGEHERQLRGRQRLPEGEPLQGLHLREEGEASPRLVHSAGGIRTRRGLQHKVAKYNYCHCQLCVFQREHRVLSLKGVALVVLVLVVVVFALVRVLVVTLCKSSKFSLETRWHIRSALVVLYFVCACLECLTK